LIEVNNLNNVLYQVSITDESKNRISEHFQKDAIKGSTFKIGWFILKSFSFICLQIFEKNEKS